MKSQVLTPGKKNKNITTLSSAQLAQREVKLKLSRKIGACIFFTNKISAVYIT